MARDLTEPVIAKLRRDKFGASAERGRNLLDQLELELGERHCQVEGFWPERAGWAKLAG